MVFVSESNSIITLRLIDNTNGTPVESEHYLVSPYHRPEHAVSYLADPACDPKSFQDAMSRPDKKQWLRAFQDELYNLKDSWCFCDRSDIPKTAPCVRTHTVWTKKLNADGSVDRYKVRCVLDCSSMTEADVKGEIYQHVCHMDTLHTFAATAAQFDECLVTADIDAAFLQGTSSTEMYAIPPQSG